MVLGLGVCGRGGAVYAVAGTGGGLSVGGRTGRESNGIVVYERNMNDYDDDDDHYDWRRRRRRTGLYRYPPGTPPRVMLLFYAQKAPASASNAITRIDRLTFLYGKPAPPHPPYPTDGRPGDWNKVTGPRPDRHGGTAARPFASLSRTTRPTITRRFVGTHGERLVRAGYRRVSAGGGPSRARRECSVNAATTRRRRSVANNRVRGQSTDRKREARSTKKKKNVKSG